jgi:hypothetical protein
LAQVAVAMGVSKRTGNSAWLINARGVTTSSDKIFWPITPAISPQSPHFHRNQLDRS